MWFEGKLILPNVNIVRAFQIRENHKQPADFTIASKFDLEILSDVEPGLPLTENAKHTLASTKSLVEDINRNLLISPKSCAEYAKRMVVLRQRAEEIGLVPVYHYTAASSGPAISSSGFRMSTQGQGDGGVYFSMLGPCAYKFGTDLYEAKLIASCFGSSRVDEYKGKHKLDCVLVYGVDPLILSDVPGGRDDAKMVKKVMFESFSLPTEDGNYFLRPDRILGMFLLDPGHVPGDYMEAQEMLNTEISKDQANKLLLNEITSARKDQVVLEISQKLDEMRELKHVAKRLSLPRHGVFDFVKQKVNGNPRTKNESFERNAASFPTIRFSIEQSLADVTLSGSVEEEFNSETHNPRAFARITKRDIIGCDDAKIPTSKWGVSI